jgi:hypothetical protein
MRMNLEIIAVTTYQANITSSVILSIFVTFHLFNITFVLCQDKNSTVNLKEVNERSHCLRLGNIIKIDNKLILL